MNDILVSIIIPTYNRVELLIYTLKTVEIIKQQCVFGIEVIVVDDGSLDNTPQIIKNKFSWVRLLKQKNKGAPAARNKGLRESKGKYIHYLDSDDLIEPGFFESKIDILENKPKIAGAYGQFEFFNSVKYFNDKYIIPRKTQYPLLEPPNYTEHLKRLCGGWYIHPSAVLWRKNNIIKIGGHDEKIKINQDVDLMFRILVNENAIIGTQSGRALIRIHDGDRVGVIGESIEKLEQIYQLRKSFKLKLEQSQLDSREIRDALARYCFGYWVVYRKKIPNIANKFLNLSDELYPKLDVKGHWYFKLLGKIAGKTNAVILKDKLSAIIRF